MCFIAGKCMGSIKNVYQDIREKRKKGFGENTCTFKTVSHFQGGGGGLGRISAAELQSYNESLIGDYLTSSEDEVIPEEPIIEATEDVDKVQMVWTLLTYLGIFPPFHCLFSQKMAQK